MRMCKDLTEASTMKEIVEEYNAITKAMDEIYQTYVAAVHLDPEYKELKKYQLRTQYYMRSKAYGSEEK